MWEGGQRCKECYTKKMQENKKSAEHYKEYMKNWQREKRKNEPDYYDKYIKNICKCGKAKCKKFEICRECWLKKISENKQTKEAKKECNKKWRAKNRKRINKYARGKNYDALHRQNLTDRYVKKTIVQGTVSLKAGDIPKELIELKRALLTLGRKINPQQHKGKKQWHVQTKHNQFPN